MPVIRHGSTRFDIFHSHGDIRIVNPGLGPLVTALLFLGAGPALHRPLFLFLFLRYLATAPRASVDFDRHAILFAPIETVPFVMW